jgi:hypothetical protein
VTAAYLGNHVVHIPSGNEENPAAYIPGNWTGPGSCGSLTVSPGTGKPCSSTGNTNARRATALANPTGGAYYSEVSVMYDGSSSIYDGLLLTVQHRFAKYFTLLSNYTWSHCITGGTDVGDLGGNTFQNPASPGADRSNCGEDVRNNFVTSMVARSEVKGGNNVKRALLSGWQLAPIVSVDSGTRVTPTTGTDASLTGVGVDRPNLVGDPYVHGLARKFRLNPASFQKNAPGTYGNTKPYSLVGPTYADLDAAVSRFFPLPETMQLEFRSECFNCLNHPNLLGPTAALNSSLFGQITTAAPPRILQLSLKVNF